MTVDDVINYVKQTGHRIFPVSDGKCLSYVGSAIPRKQPLVKWTEQATNDIGTIRTWWTKWPTALVGRAETTGELTIDIDRHGNGVDGVKTLEALVKTNKALTKLFADTRRICTPTGGYHFNFTNPQCFVIKQTQGIWPGIDIRTDSKGFLVGPPSDGYVIENDGPRLPITHDFFDIYKSESKNQELKARVDLDNGIIGDGQRNGTLTQYAGKFRNMGLPEEVIVDALSSMNENMCIEPLPDAEIKSIARSVSRYAPGAFFIEYSKVKFSPLGKGSTTNG